MNCQTLILVKSCINHFCFSSIPTKPAVSLGKGRKGLDALQ